MYIFDLDGTITDSNDLWIEVDMEFLSRRGLKITPEYEELVGKAIFPTAAQYTREYYGLEESPESIMAEWESLAEYHYTHTVTLKPGAKELLSRCYDAGIPMTLFTACRSSLCHTVLRRFELEQFFEHIIFAEEIGLEKHDPKCFTRLCEIIGTAPSECTLIDDSAANCATAVASGMAAIGVYDKFNDHRQEELKAASTRYVHSLEELLADFENT